MIVLLWPLRINIRREIEFRNKSRFSKPIRTIFYLFTFELVSIQIVDNQLFYICATAKILYVDFEFNCDRNYNILYYVSYTNTKVKLRVDNRYT